MKTKKVLSLLLVALMMIPDTTVFARDFSDGYGSVRNAEDIEDAGAEDVSGSLEISGSLSEEDVLLGEAAELPDDEDVEAGEAEITQETVSGPETAIAEEVPEEAEVDDAPEFLGTGEGGNGESEWPTYEAGDWYKDYDYSFHYIPETVDPEDHHIVHHEEYQLWLYRYTPREEHKNDTRIVVPAYGAAWKHEVWQDTTMWDGPDDKIIGYRTVLADSQSRVSSYDSIWDAGKDVITGIKIEDAVKTQYNCKFMFFGLGELTELVIDGLDTADATNMYGMFEGCSKLKKLDLTSKDISAKITYTQKSWDTSKVENMTSMFEGCSALEELILGKTFNTSRVTNMYHMFASLKSIKTLDLTMLDTSNVTGMTGMFQYCGDTIEDDDWNVIGKTGLETIKFGTGWNTEKVTSMESMFECCYNLESLDLSGFDTGEVTTMSAMFRNCESLAAIDVSDFNTSSLASNGMSMMFDGCSSLTSINVSGFDIPENGYFPSFRNCKELKTLDLSHWGDVNPSNMMSMFSGCSSLESIIWPTGLDTSAVTDMDYMFEGCVSLKSIDLRKFDTSNVEHMREMFEDCASLETLDVSGFNTSKVKDMYLMFAGCKKLKTLDLGSFDFTAVNAEAVNDSYKLTKLFADTGIHTLFLPVKAMSGYDFTSYDNNCRSYNDQEGTPLLMIYYAGTEDQWKALNNKTGYSSYSRTDIAVVYDYAGEGKMWTTPADWYRDYEYELIDGEILLHHSKGTIKQNFINIPASVEINGNNYRVVIDFVPAEGSYSDSMWKKDTDTILGIRFEEGVKTSENCKYLFYYLSKLQIADLSGLDTSAATTMENMFCYCSKLRAFLPGKKFNTSNVTDMSGMFSHCTIMKKIDVSKFNTSNVTDMNGMFSFCDAVEELDVSGFDTKKVTNMDSMFYSCLKLKTLDVKKFNTKKVGYMGHMFDSCKCLESLDLTGFDTAKVNDMQGMFTDTDALTTLDLRSFDFGRVRATENDHRGEYMDTIIYNAGVKDLYLPAEAMCWFDFTDDDSKAPKLEKIWYAGSKTQWEALNNTLPEGVTIEYNVDPIEKPAEVIVPGLEDYRCSVDKENLLVFIHESKGTITQSDIVIPATVTINATQYQVVIDKDTDYEYSALWCDKDREVIRSIRFAKGVRLSETSGCLFGYMRLTSLDVSGLDTSGTTNMRGMFEMIYGLENLDVSMLDTSNVTNMSHMFYSCQELKNLKLKGIDTSKVKDMSSMFRECCSLTSLDLSGISTASATDIEFMFEDCSSLQSIDVSGFNTAKAEAVRGMFTDCSSLKRLDLRAWDFSKVNSILYNNVGKYEKPDAYYAAGLITGSGIMDLYIPETFLQHLDMTLPAEWDGDTPVSSGNIAPNLRRVYYAGTKQQWKDQVVRLPESVELICDYTGDMKDIPGYVTDIRMDPDKLTKKINTDSFTLTAVITPADAADTRVVWSVGDDEIAQIVNTEYVAENGMLKSKALIHTMGLGSTQIKVKAVSSKQGTEVSAACTLTVVSEDYVETKATGVSIFPASATIYTGSEDNSVQLVATVTPENTTDKSVTWKSSNDKVARVDASGLVLAVAAGKATITATTADGSNKSATCSITVRSKVTSVELTSATDRVQTGKTLKITPVFNEGMTNSPLIWESSDSTIATVSSTGTVKGESTGEVTIWATSAEDSNVRGSIDLTVYDPVTSISFSAKTLKLGKGESYSGFKAVVKPETASDRDVVYTSSDETIVKFMTDTDGRIAYGPDGSVTLLAGTKTGTATVSAKAVDGSGKSATCKVTVGNDVKKIVLKEKNNKTSVAKGSKLTMKAVFNDGVKADQPANTAVVWSIVSSEDIDGNDTEKTIATINTKGELVGKNAGRVCIRATHTASGTVSGIYTINIYVPIKKVKLSDKKLSLSAGSEYVLKAAVTPSDATLTKGGIGAYASTGVKWTIIKGDKDANGNYFVKVDEDTGRVTSPALMAEGQKVTATVKATVVGDNGVNKWKTKTATCTVTVKNNVKVSKVVPDAARLSMGAGSTRTLKADVVPATADNKELTYVSSNEGVVQLKKNGDNIEFNEDGSVTLIAKSAGNAVITVKAADGSNKKATCKVTVGNPVTAVTIKAKKTQKRLIVGKSTTLKSAVSAAGNKKPANKTVEWSVVSVKNAEGTALNKDAFGSVATVNAKGVVKAIAPGVITVRATSTEKPEAGQAQYADFSITTYVPIKKLAINRTKAIIGEGKVSSGAGNILVKTTPGNACDPENLTQKIKWTSSNPDVIRIAALPAGDEPPEFSADTSRSGVYVPAATEIVYKAVAPGKAKIIGTTTDGSKKTVKCTITVRGRMKEEDVKLYIKSVSKKLKSVKVSATSASTAQKNMTVTGLPKKKSLTLTPVLTAKASDKSLTFISSDTSVVTVTKKGVIKAVGSGTATVTMYTTDGGYTATCVVTVP